MQPAAGTHITTTSAMRDSSGAPITDCLEPHIQKFDGVCVCARVRVCVCMCVRVCVCVCVLRLTRSPTHFLMQN